MSREGQEKPAAASQAGDAGKPQAASKAATRTAGRRTVATAKKAVSAKKPVAAKKRVPSVKKAVKAPAKAPVKAVKRSAAQRPVTEKAVKAVKPAKPAVKEKLKKPKLVRDSFTMPESEYQVLGDVKKAFLKIGVSVKKSELLRAGVALIKAMETAKLKTVIAGLPPIKAGRPKKDK